MDSTSARKRPASVVLLAPRLSQHCDWGRLVIRRIRIVPVQLIVVIECQTLAQKLAGKLISLGT